jgi:hypothetical protein
VEIEVRKMSELVGQLDERLRDFVIVPTSTSGKTGHHLNVSVKNFGIFQLTQERITCIGD